MQYPRDLPENNHSKRTVVPFFLVLAAVLCFFMVPVTAHAPSNIAIAYNPDMHKLSVTVTHPVDDPKTHYVRGVQVKINGEVISDPPYKKPAGQEFLHLHV
jgi:hypothetical protein